MRQRIGFCTTRDGTRIAYATTGTGRPLVRVGPWLTHIELDGDSTVWKPWLDAFSGERVLVRFDLRGSGLSDRQVEKLSLDAWIQDLQAVVDSLGLDRFPLLGMCQGGPIALAYADRHPERVSRLILYDSYLSGGLTDDGPPEMAEQAPVLGEMIRVGWGRDTPAFRELFANLLMPDAPPEVPRWFSEVHDSTASTDVAERMWHAFHRFDVAREAAGVEVPTLVFHVKGDAMVPFDAGRRVAAEIPGARFVPLEGRNHILFPWDPAWQQFREETQRFLAEEDGVAPDVDQPGLSALTERERAVLDLMAQGLANDEIAGALCITPKSVRNYVSRVFGKLGVERRAQAIVLAREAGLGMRRSERPSSPA